MKDDITDTLIPIVAILYFSIVLAVICNAFGYKKGFEEGYKTSEEDAIKKIDSLLDADAEGKFIDEQIIILTK